MESEEQQPEDEENCADISRLDYVEFVKLIFDHPEPESQFGDKWYMERTLELSISRIPTVLEYLIALCKSFSSVAAQYTMKQIDQGMWLLMGPGGQPDPTIPDCLFSRNTYCCPEHPREEAPLELRLECIRSFYFLYADFVAHSSDEVMGNSFYMWWDSLFCEFWVNVESRRDRLDRFGTAAATGYSQLDNDEQLVLDTMFHTLTRILEIGETLCTEAALHGLGHSNHPAASRVVQEYIDKHIDELAPEGIKWLEQCRDGTVQ
jgi:hypothetical protein